MKTLYSNNHSICKLPDQKPTDSLFTNLLSIHRSRDIYQRRNSIDCILDEVYTTDVKLDSVIWANVHASPTTPAILLDHCMAIIHVNGIHETHIFLAGTAALTPLIDCDCHPRHFCDFLTNYRFQIGQHLPKATTRATITDC